MRVGVGERTLVNWPVVGCGPSCPALEVSREHPFEGRIEILYPYSVITELSPQFQFRLLTCIHVGGQTPTNGHGPLGLGVRPPPPPKPSRRFAASHTSREERERCCCYSSRLRAGQEWALLGAAGHFNGGRYLPRGEVCQAQSRCLSALRDGRLGVSLGPLPRQRAPSQCAGAGEPE